MKKLSFVLSLLLLSVNLGTLQAADSSKPCEKEILSLVQMGFGSFPGHKPTQFTVAQEANLVTLNGTKILAYMTTIALDYTSDPNPAVPNAYNFYFNPENCKFLNGMAIPQVGANTANMNEIPTNCEKSKILEKINQLLKDQELAGKTVSDLLFPSYVDYYSPTMSETSSFSVFNSLKIDGKLHVLVTYFNANTCEESQHYFSEQIPYSR
jgi:hypothetical protein